MRPISGQEGDERKNGVLPSYFSVIMKKNKLARFCEDKQKHQIISGINGTLKSIVVIIHYEKVAHDT